MRFDHIQIPKENLAKLYELHGSLRDSFNRPIDGKCMFRSGGCVEPPIKSHLLARSWLQRIADTSNHVLEFDMSVKKVIQRLPDIEANRVGINEATTFRGFCDKHDSSLFGCLETKPFAATPEQLTALRYRSISREAFGKHRKATAAPQKAISYH